MHGRFSKLTKAVVKQYDDKYPEAKYREVEFYKSMRSRNTRYICKCIEILSDKVILEYVGPTVIDFIQDDNKISLKWFSQLSSALMSIHLLGWYHGDISCNNVLVDDWGNLVLCDFTSSGRVNIDKPRRGTFGFEPPSQEENQQSADVYSLGVLFWSIINRERPPRNFSFFSDSVDNDGNPKVTEVDKKYHSEVLDMSKCSNYKDLILKMTSPLSSRPSSTDIYNFCTNNEYQQ